MKNVTMRDIARKLGVSVVTVSKALNDKEGVSDALKEKIKQTADAMGYRFNAAAKSMKAGLAYNIGILIAERFTGPEQSFYLHFHNQLTRMLGEQHYYGILHILTAREEEQLVLPKMYYEKKVDGFIVLGQISRPYIKKLEEIETPCVFLDFYTDHAHVDAIISDSFFGVYEMTNYLIACGHAKIAFVGSIEATSSIQDRFLGYYKSLLEHRIPLRQDYIVPDRDATGAYIDLHIPDDLPTAFVCNNDQVAYNLIQTLNRRSIRVPEDCSVVGFDNDLYATLSDPPLTTIEADTEEMARAAVQTIIKRIRKEPMPYGRVLVKSRIIHRASVRVLSDREPGKGSANAEAANAEAANAEAGEKNGEAG